MGITLGGAGGRYDVRPAHPSIRGPFTGFAAMMKDATQGAGGGLLSLIGATHMTGSESGLVSMGASDIGFLNEIWSSLAANGMAGPVELMGGVALFMAARRTISRTIGLIAFIAFVAAIANGYSVADMLGWVSNLLVGAAGALENIPVSETIGA